LIFLFILVCYVDWFWTWWSACFSLRLFELINCIITKSLFKTLNKLICSLGCCPCVFPKRVCKCTLTTAIHSLVLIWNILNVFLITQNPQKFVLWLLLCGTLRFFTLLHLLMLLKYHVHALLLRVGLVLHFCGSNSALLFFRTLYEQLSKLWLSHTLSFLMIWLIWHLNRHITL